MSDLTEFLLARIAEDEAVARAASKHGAVWSQPDRDRSPGLIESEGAVIVYDEGSPTQADADHITRHDPARVLAECAAKRRIISGLTPGYTYGDWRDGGDHFVMRHLATVYTDHADYREEWRPKQPWTQ